MTAKARQSCTFCFRTRRLSKRGLEATERLQDTHDRPSLHKLCTVRSSYGSSGSPCICLEEALGASGDRVCIQTGKSRKSSSIMPREAGGGLSVVCLRLLLPQGIGGVSDPPAYWPLICYGAFGGVISVSGSVSGSVSVSASLSVSACLCVCVCVCLCVCPCACLCACLFICLRNSIPRAQSALTSSGWNWCSPYPAERVSRSLAGSLDLHRPECCMSGPKRRNHTRKSGTFDLLLDVIGEEGRTQIFMSDQQAHLGANALHAMLSN